MFITEELLNDEMGHNIVAINTPELQDFVKKALDVYSNTNKLNIANQVADILLAMLKKRKQITDGENFKPWVEVMIAAALLHNLFYDATLTSLFMAREKLQPFADECNVPQNASYSIFQAIECQLGDDTPIESCRPIPSTPNELFAWSCWFVEELHGWKEVL